VDAACRDLIDQRCANIATENLCAPYGEPCLDPLPYSLDGKVATRLLRRSIARCLACILFNFAFSCSCVTIVSPSSAIIALSFAISTHRTARCRRRSAARRNRRHRRRQRVCDLVNLRQFCFSICSYVGCTGDILFVVCVSLKTIVGCSCVAGLIFAFTRYRNSQCVSFLRCCVCSVIKRYTLVGRKQLTTHVTQNSLVCDRCEHASSIVSIRVFTTQ
jgi:hypothetical protein